MARPGYEDAVGWIVRERAGQGGWPPMDVRKVSGWLVVRMVADLYAQPVSMVARDVIEQSEERQ